MWNTNNYTVSYRRKKLYWFEPEMSAGPLTDTVMAPTLPMVAAADMAREDFFMQWGLNDIFSTMQVVVKQIFFAFFIQFFFPNVFLRL